MAMPPTSAAAPMPADGAAPPEVVATILKNKDGSYMLVAGDEPEPGMPGEEGAEMAPEGKTFDTPQALLKGVMEMLNDGGAAEDSFAKGFRGEPDEMAKPPGGPMA